MKKNKILPIRHGEDLARAFHESYERLAPDFGYETRKETRDFDPTTPNGKLMVAVCSEMLKRLEIQIGAIEEAVNEGLFRAKDAKEDPAQWIISRLRRLRGISEE